MRAVLTALDGLSRPASVRDLVAAVGRTRAVTYREVRAVADRLAASGQLRRIRAGTANRYEIAADRDDRTARLVADLLRLSDSPERVAAAALALVRREGPASVPLASGPSAS